MVQEHPTIRTGCLLRNYRVVEIDTDFILEFIIPVHGSIVVAFKDPISLPWQEGTHKIGALPVDLLLKIAKVHFATSQLQSCSCSSVFETVRVLLIAASSITDMTWKFLHYGPEVDL